MLLLVLTVVNHVAAGWLLRIKRQSQRAIILTATVTISLALLFYFKYFNFFADSVNQLAEQLGGESLLPLVKVALPVGISFLTFQAITYPLDVYHGRYSRACTLLDFALFMAFFPRLLSGPIVRASYFLPQLAPPEPPVVADEMRIDGLMLVMRGLIKKVVIADVLGAQLVDPAFGNYAAYSSSFLLLGMFGYSLQAYYDLSGYTDMALGVARMFGYKLPVNFNRPYLATSVANFWQRWHITMSSFFRDYVYQALTARNPNRTYFNLVIVFVLIGLWHGAGWNFVVYGIIHGSLVAIEHYVTHRQADRASGSRNPLRGVRLILRIALVFSFVSLTRVLFRSDSLGAAGDYLLAIVSAQPGEFPLRSIGVAALVLSVLLHFSPMSWRDKLMDRGVAMPAWAMAGAFVGLVYVVIAFSSSGGGFIYFQF